ncbi:unnamed protein product [Brassica oleracea]|uniref:Uncharacterized protein n=1 Tax=Brassica oleracea TaxID=3712 RepID=A0A3P6CAW9_BRAOL|nr:unnamed protein product [Brassica oleracea]
MFALNPEMLDTTLVNIWPNERLVLHQPETNKAKENSESEYNDEIQRYLETREYTARRRPSVRSGFALNLCGFIVFFRALMILDRALRPGVEWGENPPPTIALP